MARLVEAVRPEARLVLVGDPGQLTSIEAGAVLGDIVRAGGEGVVVLEHVYRFGAGIDALADAIRDGDGDAVIAALTAGHEDVSWLPGRRRRPGGAGGSSPRSATAPSRPRARSSKRHARATAEAAIGALAAFRILCAHRRGSLRRQRLDLAHRGLAGGRARTRALVRGPPAAGDRERLRAAALQRRHGRDRRQARRPSRRRLRAPRRGRRVHARRGSAPSRRSTR